MVDSLFFSSIWLLYKMFWFVLSDSVSRCVWKPEVNIRSLNYSLPCLLRRSHLHGAHSLPRLASQQGTRIFLSPSLQRWYYRCTLPHLGSPCLLVDCLVGWLVWFGLALLYVGTGGSKLRPSCCVTNFAWTELSQQLQIYFLHQCEKCHTIDISVLVVIMTKWENMSHVLIK